MSLNLIAGVDFPSQLPSATAPFFLLGRNAAGHWVIRETTGRKAGLFRTRQAAIIYARDETWDGNFIIVEQLEGLEQRHIKRAAYMRLDIYGQFVVSVITPKGGWSKGRPVALIEGRGECYPIDLLIPNDLSEDQLQRYVTNRFSTFAKPGSEVRRLDAACRSPSNQRRKSSADQPR